MALSLGTALVSVHLSLSLVHTHIRIYTHIHTHTSHRHTGSASGQITSLAAGALAAVYDRQDDRLALSARALQAEEADRVVWVQAVTAALTQ